MTKIIKFRYLNHRGEMWERTLDVTAIEFIHKPGYGYQPGWFISGFDRDRQGDVRRSFALSHIDLPGDGITPVYKLLIL